MLLKLLTASVQPGPFYGHVTAAELTAANSGFARYQLTIEPCIAFIFQDKSVLGTLDAVFLSYDSKNKLLPECRFDI